MRAAKQRRHVERAVCGRAVAARQDALEIRVDGDYTAGVGFVHQPPELRRVNAPRLSAVKVAVSEM